MRHVLIPVVLCLCATAAGAETLVLRSGRLVDGRGGRALIEDRSYAEEARTLLKRLH